MQFVRCGFDNPIIANAFSTAAPRYMLPRHCFVQTAQEVVTLLMLTALAIAHYTNKESLEGLCEQL